MGVTNVAVRYSRFAQDEKTHAPDKSKVEVEVQSDDEGFGSDAGVHLWDKTGKYVDVMLPYEKTKPESSPDAFWGGQGYDGKGYQIDLTDLKDASGNPVELDPDSLMATAFVTLTSGDRIWEGSAYGSDNNHKVEPLGIDRIRDENTLESVDGSFDLKATTRFGTVDFTVDQRDAHDYPDWEGEKGVRKIVVTDIAGQFLHRDELKILVEPQMHDTDYGYDWTGPARQKDLMDLNEMNLVTLKRVPGTNTFAADAGTDKAFVRETELQVYEGGSSLANGLRFAVLDPVTNAWFKDGDSDYFVSM